MSTPGPSGRFSPADDRPSQQSKDASKLRQIVQHFYSKAALTVISSRVNLPRSYYRNSHNVRSDRWFNIILDDSDTLAEEVSFWASLDVNEQRPPPLFVDIYLDTGELKRNQTLVVVDERGKKWDACEALEGPTSSVNQRQRRKKDRHIILERWKIHLGPPSSTTRGIFNDTMPNAYKKAVVLFRSLYTYASFLPACTFSRRLAQKPQTLSALRPTYRVYESEPDTHQAALLKRPLCPATTATTETYSFMPVLCPAGPLCIDVSYRRNCNFYVDESEAVLSSRFLGIDRDDFESSLPSSDRDQQLLARAREAGSLPSRPGLAVAQGAGQAYGSLSTYHQAGGATGTSPMSALRAVREINAESPAESSPIKSPADPRSSQSPRSSLKPAERPSEPQRRVSVSFQPPFKAGSLASSPVPGISSPLSPRPSSGESSNVSSGAIHTRNKSSTSSAPQAQPRSVSNTADLPAGSPSSGSTPAKAPPMSRYSTSFGHRRSRLSSGGGAGSKTDEDNTSSGKASQTSSNQPGSGLLAEGEDASSGSTQTDDGNISDFLTLIEQKKELGSLNKTDDASRGTTAKRTNAALSKYQRLRDSHMALTDSLSSSLVLQQSSSPSSLGRHPSSGPPALVGASISTSSSPNKPVSPHTPHTPSVPSRLSARANVDEADARTEQVRARNIQAGDATQESEGASHNTMAQSRGSTAIDIPTSPRRFQRFRRSSSIAQPQRVIDEEIGMRSASMPVDDRQDLSLSELFALQDPPQRPEEPAAHRPSIEDEGSRPASTPDHPPAFRSRLGPRGGRGSTSSAGTGSGSAGRFSFSNRAGGGGPEDDEPLLFTMSEIGAQSRRSLEEANNAKRSPGERGADSGSGSRRGSRRG